MLSRTLAGAARRMSTSGTSEIVTQQRKFVAEKSSRQAWMHEATTEDGNKMKLVWAYVGGFGTLNIAYNVYGMMSK